MSLTVEHLSSLKIARYEFTLRACDDVWLPPFLGTTFRGAFGHALKAVVCSMPHGDCKRCVFAERCLYPKIFETEANNGLLSRSKNAPRPFIFMPPIAEIGKRPSSDDWLRLRFHISAGNSIQFGLSLLGDAVSDLPYVIYAVDLMAKHGFGSERVPFALESVAAIDAQGKRETVYTPDMTRIAYHEVLQTNLAEITQVRLDSLDINNELTLCIITPMRIRVGGRVEENLDFEKLISSLSLRFSLLSETHAAQKPVYDYRSMLERARDVKTLSSNLQTLKLERYTNKQQRKIHLDGLVGDITFAGSALQELLPLIVAGEFFNVGSATAFGLGRYLIVAGK